MPLKKNDIIPLEINSCTLGGSGVGHYDSLAVFVPASAAGDSLLVHILKVKSNCAFGKIHKIITPSPDRIQNDCPSYPQCGGCVFRHISYEAELKIKYDQVRENLRRIGGIDILPEPIVGADSVDRYRNKAQYPLAREDDGVKIGFFAPRSHRVIDCRGCKLQPAEFEGILSVFREWLEEFDISLYDELTHSGLLRHIYLRYARATGEIAVCCVINADELPHCAELCERLTGSFPCIKSICVNINRDKTNVILGKTTKTLWGGESITDELCSLRFSISPQSFFQVNPAQTQRLYAKALEYAAPDESQTLLDLYCGTGTIGLSMAHRAREVIGVEIVEQAVEDAKKNALENGIKNARFICADAAKAAEILNSQGVSPDTVLLDPPRKGCDAELLKTVSELSPAKIVYISCDSATLSRDLKILTSLGYTLKSATPVDMFPRTAHVETVVLMSKEMK